MPHNVIAFNGSKMLDFFYFKVSSKIIHYLLPREVIPRSAVATAEANHQICSALFQNSTNASDISFAVFNVNMVEAAHVKHEVKLTVFISTFASLLFPLHILCPA